MVLGLVRLVVISMYALGFCIRIGFWSFRQLVTFMVLMKQLVKKVKHFLFFCKSPDKCRVLICSENYSKRIISLAAFGLPLLTRPCDSIIHGEHKPHRKLDARQSAPAKSKKAEPHTPILCRVRRVCMCACGMPRARNPPTAPAVFCATDSLQRHIPTCRCVPHTKKHQQKKSQARCRQSFKAK